MDRENLFQALLVLVVLVCLTAMHFRLERFESHTCPCEAVSEEPAPPKGSLEDLVRKLQDDGTTGVVR